MSKMRQNSTRKSRVRSVPYVKGFRLPGKKRQDAAVGLNPVPPLFQPGDQFKLVPKCTNENDWLAQYKEEGQTFDNFSAQCPWLSSRKRKAITQTFIPKGSNMVEKYPNGKIYLLPIGDFGGADCPDFDELVKFTQIFYQIPVLKMPPVPLEITETAIYWVLEDGAKIKLTTRNKQGKIQLKVNTRFIEDLARQYLPDDALCMIALTMCDLYEGNTDLYVAGLAAGRHRVAIFSFFRYHPDITFSGEFWYDVQKTITKMSTKNGRSTSSVSTEDATRKLLLERSCRLLVHETGHLLGFDHCIFYSCLMNGSGHLQEDFSQPMFLCPVDLRKLELLIGLDIIERYKQLKQFWEQHSIPEHPKWIQERLKFIENSESKENKIEID
eukprot:GHVU01233588.1.p1 GENE.GHVU01233588.1~~GHVU01233588.1.p1  ORF type:complete len:383 (+),score=37.43 GHVU01233588.1:169-1317(+)